MPHLEDEEDTNSVYKLPQSKYQGVNVDRASSDPIPGMGSLRMEDPPNVANYDPSRLAHSKPPSPLHTTSLLLCIVLWSPSSPLSSLPPSLPPSYLPPSSIMSLLF